MPWLSVYNSTQFIMSSHIFFLLKGISILPQKHDQLRHLKCAWFISVILILF